MEADVFVLGHDAFGLEGLRDVDVLRFVQRRHAELAAQRILGVIVQKVDAVDGADVHARVTFDAELFGEHRLHVAIETARGFFQCALFVETQFHFQPDIFQRRLEVGVGHVHATAGIIVVLVGPLVDAHLLADEVVAGGRAFGDRLAVAERINRDGGLMAVADGPDDVVGPPRAVAAEKHLWIGRLERYFVDGGHIVFAKCNADVALDPRERVVLADGHQHVVAVDGHQFA